MRQHKTKAPPQGARVGAKENTAHYTTRRTAMDKFWNKKRRILRLLASGQSLNRFEATMNGDACLHSTVSKIQDDGIMVERAPETVRGWHGNPTVLMRYKLDGVERQKACRQLASGLCGAGLAADTQAALQILQTAELGG